MVCKKLPSNTEQLIFGVAKQSICDSYFRSVRITMNEVPKQKKPKVISGPMVYFSRTNLIPGEVNAVKNKLTTQ